ncbi:ABC transporter substrate-binding protein [Paenarthrobacter sp. PH39-S1]|uniref:ABC transporter substrate-binding protein n=1 Tax=Paenarthrobacter sp. PH39-S1 TaxID=3046204 RepID=UPI0024BA0E26|nr:ABC transporter substrate-binding protein [Paenarthrobacter sp. PH39-S1]MDJ0356225.1 ABC transporter substrate-binding protein [Paenarthrobacter sp. PH39-S1]
MHPSRKSILVTGCLLLALSMSACTTVSEAAPKNSGVDTSAAAPSITEIKVNQKARDLLPESIRSAGVLRVASDPTYAPFEYFDTDNKTIIGWDVDFSDAVAAALGLKAEHVAGTFDTILPGLASGKYDMALSAYSITPEREKIVDFVQYINGGSGVAVMAGNPQNITMDPTSMCGKKIAGQKGSIQSMELIPSFSKECTASGKAAIEVQNFPAQTEANLALTSGRVDGVVADSTSLAYQSKLAGNKFELAKGKDYDPAPVGLALAKDSGLKDAVTEATRDVLDSTFYRGISSKWGLPDSVLVTSDVLDKK